MTTGDLIQALYEHSQQAYKNNDAAAENLFFTAADRLYDLEVELNCIKRDNNYLRLLAETANQRSADYRAMRDRALKAETELELEKNKHVKIQYDNHEYTISEICRELDILRAALDEAKRQIREGGEHMIGERMGPRHHEEDQWA